MMEAAMTVTHEQAARYDGIVSNLLRITRASRTTLRLDFNGTAFPVVAEALAEGIRSIKDGTFDFTRTPSSRFVLERRTILVQPDCCKGPHPPPPDLVKVYGVRAQMLGPVLQGDRVVGIVSVHYADRAREWSTADVAALESAIAGITADLASRHGLT
jgi:maleate isomerase